MTAAIVDPGPRASTPALMLELRRWIRDATGLTITDQNAAPVDLAVRIQSERLRLEPMDFVRRLMGGKIGAQGFIDEITTHESYFFRAREQMQFVVERLIPERLQRAPGRQVRVLSLPCARGEEPYSLAILLAEAGIPSEAVEIVGGDIARSCVEEARAGIYSPLALRRTDPGRARRWFRAHGERGVALARDILPRVAFHRMNILSDAERLLRPPFDLVFCENLLIYFDTENVQRALQVIRRLLAEDGWLFVDYAEWQLPRALFRLQEMDGRVGFRPQRLPPGGEVGSAVNRPHSRRRLDTRRADSRAATEAATRVANDMQCELTRGADLYAAKRFTEALLAFEQVLRRDPQDPRALLGKARVLADCGEDFEALEILEQALAVADGQAGQETSGRIDALSGQGRQRVEILALIAVLLHKKGLSDLAAQYLRRVSLLDPHHRALRLLV
jgi:chemotaxis protein methyltransferase WspC